MQKIQSVQMENSAGVATSVPQVDENATTHTQSIYRRDIDGLRCIAITSVVLFHVGLHGFSGGFVGVDVFFVISGYLIGGLIYRDVAVGTFSILNFYQRRAKRILPAFFAVMLASYALGFLLLSPEELKSFCKQALAALTSTSNIYYWWANDYFAADADLNALLMTWSLAVEEQFYVFFPLLMLILYRRSSRHLMASILMLSIASFAASWILIQQYPTAVFYLLPTRAWELGIGAMLAIREMSRSSLNIHERPLWWSQAMALVGVGLLVFAIVFYDRNTPFPGAAAAAPVLGTALLIAARRSFVNQVILSATPMVAIGLISYSWYLWHWPLLSFARIVSGGDLKPEAGFAILAAALLLAAVTYLAIEQPYRKSKTEAKPLLIRYALLTCLVLLPALVGLGTRGWPQRFDNLRQLEAEALRIRSDPCMAPYGPNRPHLAPPCVAADQNAPALVLLGDSHAAALSGALRAASSNAGYAFEQVTKSSCPQLGPVTRYMPDFPQHQSQCADFNKMVLQRVLEREQVKLVVLAGFWSAPFGEESRGNTFVDTREQPGDISREQSWNNLRAGLEQTIIDLKAAGKTVFVVVDIPRFDINPIDVMRADAVQWRRMLAGLLSSPMVAGSAPRESAISPNDDRASSILRDSADKHGVTVVDTTRHLCDARSCYFIAEGRLLYSDRQHLTRFGAERALADLDLRAVAQRSMR